MADGTVTGEFRLYTVQAQRELMKLQREGKATDQQFEKLGRDLDTVGSRRQQAQIRHYREESRKLGTEAARASRGVGKLAGETDRLGKAVGRTTTGRRGGGGAAGIGGLIGMGRSLRTVAIQGAIALPVIRSLTGAVGALATSVASAAGGAGAVGVAGITGLVTGIGGVAAVAIPAAKAIKEVADAQAKYNEIVKEYGRRSKEAREARGLLTEARRGAPGGTSALVNEARAFGEAWKQATMVGQRSLIGFARNAVQTGRNMTPFLSRLANDMSKAFSVQGGRALDFLQGKRVKAGLTAGAGIFTENLSNVRRIGQATVEMFLNITRAARPFVKEFTTFTRDFFERARDRSRNIVEMRRAIGGMVDNLRSVGRLGGAGIRLLSALLGAGGTDAGRGLTDSATRQLDRWTQWINKNPAKIQEFFRQSADDARKLASALSDIVQMLWSMADALRPVIPLISTVASAAGALGPVGTIAAGSVALRGYRAATTGAAGPGIVGTLLGGGRRGVPAGRGATVGARLTGGAAAVGGGGGVMGALRGGGALGVARGALGVAGKALWPLAALQAGLGALGTEGGVGRRAQGALSASTFGLINAPTSYADLAAQGAGRVPNYTTPGTVRGARGRLASNLEKQRELEAQLTSTRTVQRFTGGRGGGSVSNVQVASLSEEDRKRVEGQIEKLKEHEEALRLDTAALRDARATKQEALAPGRAADVAKAFRIRSRRGDAAAAAGAVPRDIAQSLNKATSFRGKKATAEASLEWLNEAKKHNPELRKVYTETVERIEKRFRKMGTNVQVINGQIFRNSKNQWRNIRNALTTQSERAKQEVDEDFTDIQQKMVKELKSMGYTGKEATSIVAATERGTRQGNQTTNAINQAQRVSPSYTESRARGGRIKGRGLRDTVPVGDGGTAAPGELIVNRHTEEDHDRDARMLGLPSLGQRVKRERRPHSAPRKVKRGTDVYLARARGGRVAALMGASPGLAKYAQMGTNFGLQVTSGARPGSITSSGNVSLHSSGDAIDVGGGTSAMLQYAKAMARRFGSGLDELIHTPLGYGIKNGARVPAYATADHYDHVHVGDRSPGGGGGIPLGGPGGGVVDPINIRARRSQLGGVPGAMSTRHAEVLTRAMEKRVNRKIGAGLPGGGGGSPTQGILSFRQVARIAEAAGLPGVTFAQIAKGESGFNPRAVGHDPGGTQGLGLWQITTGYNDDIIERFGGRQAMFNARTNAQAAKAIYDRAGIGAWYGTRYMTDPNAHYQGRAKGGRIGGAAHAGWFAGGGSFTTNGPTMFGAGERGKEKVTITPKGQAGGAGVNVVIHMGSVTVANIDQAGALGDQIGQRVAAKIASAVREAAIA